ncbi:MAG: hypothetical protein AVDCRST_MAG02-4285, partial [uncultured Rubrobacteraceae bacterium]
EAPRRRPRPRAGPAGRGERAAQEAIGGGPRQGGQGPGRRARTLLWPLGFKQGLPGRDGDRGGHEGRRGQGAGGGPQRRGPPGLRLDLRRARRPAGTDSGPRGGRRPRLRRQRGRGPPAHEGAGRAARWRARPRLRAWRGRPGRHRRAAQGAPL